MAILKQIRMVPLVFLMPFIFVNPAFAATSSVASMSQGIAAWGNQGIFGSMFFEI